MSPNQQEPPTVSFSHSQALPVDASPYEFCGCVWALTFCLCLCHPFIARWHLVSQPPPPLHLSYNLHHKLICIWYDESYLHQLVHLKLELCTTWCLNLDGFKLHGFNCQWWTAAVVACHSLFAFLHPKTQLFQCHDIYNQNCCQYSLQHTQAFLNK